MDRVHRTAEQLQAMIQVRLYAHPDVQRLLAQGTPPNGLPAARLPSLHPVPGRPQNWECRAVMNAGGLELEIAAIIDGLRESFDLDPAQ